jgi:uncharacterized membrane protein
VRTEKEQYNFNLVQTQYPTMSLSNEILQNLSIMIDEIAPMLPLIFAYLTLFVTIIYTYIFIRDVLIDNAESIQRFFKRLFRIALILLSIAIIIHFGLYITELLAQINLLEYSLSRKDDMILLLELKLHDAELLYKLEKSKDCVISVSKR